MGAAVDRSPQWVPRRARMRFARLDEHLSGPTQRVHPPPPRAPLRAAAVVPPEYRSRESGAHLVGADVAAARDECAAAQRRRDLRVRFGARSRPQRSVASCRVRPAHTPKRRVASSVRQKRPHGSMPTRLHEIAAGTRRRRRASTAGGSRRPPSSWPAGAVLRDGSGAFRRPAGTAATSQPREPCRDGCRRQPFPCRTPARRSHETDLMRIGAN